MLVVMIRQREEDKGAHSSDAPQSLLAMHALLTAPPNRLSPLCTARNYFAVTQMKTPLYIEGRQLQRMQWPTRAAVEKRSRNSVPFLQAALGLASLATRYPALGPQSVQIFH